MWTPVAALAAAVVLVAVAAVVLEPVAAVRLLTRVTRWAPLAVRTAG